MNAEAIILAGGLGTRLRSAVSDVPKCLAPVAGKPFLSYVIEHLIKEGVESFIFSLGHMHETIMDYINFQYRPLYKQADKLKIQFSVEKEPLGTGGAIKLACGMATQKNVLVLNGDTLFTLDVQKLTAFHNMCGADCTLSLKPMHQFDRYGAVELNSDYSVASFNEKKYYENGMINAGVYALHAVQFVQEDKPEIFSFEKDYLEKYIGKKRFYGMVQDKYFIDIGIPEDYQRAQKELGNQN